MNRHEVIRKQRTCGQDLSSNEQTNYAGNRNICNYVLVLCE